MLYRWEGIVIRTTDYGEGHKILTLYTKQAGKQGVIVRGAKKVKSRHTAIAQLFTHGDFAVFKGQSLASLNHGEIIEAHRGLREDLHKAAHASYLAEMMDRLMPDGEPDERMFEQLNAGLTAMEEGKDPAIVNHIMEMKLLALSGYLPQLDECVSCGRTEGPFAFSGAQGGILCKACRFRDPQAKQLPEAVLRLLRVFQRTDLRRLGHVEVKPETKAWLKAVMRDFMDRHLDIRWKARGFLDQLEKYDL
ncbi:DNA repair protein RecO [Paenibacillus sp. J31TS4]|uniref:DNA repair protein RecO n=1 Tax=Paenibacillus sp. J31TS4 TaxID=2807195 RepID=UPI001B1D6D9D|nr:DNA repair protein RecO [Paenibacillus sp. J31TS4]GIP39619.1 DNA repair protein RecO [Paenibacillus sp. J31TS4]